jgi:hypothetical protein
MVRRTVTCHAVPDLTVIWDLQEETKFGGWGVSLLDEP